MKKTKAAKKIHRVMKEFSEGTLHSGSTTGPKVKSRRQAIAIAMAESGQGRRTRKKR